MIAAALERGIDVVGELELAWRAMPNRFVAVTGTNGKTTTVELLGHVYRSAGEPVAVAGNVGTPLSSLVGEVEPDATVVCEASSFQLEDSAHFAPECAVFLNLAPDHLDRHARPRRPTWRRSCGSSPTRATTTSPSTTPTTRRWPASTSAAAPAGSPSAHGAGPDCEVAARRGDDLLRRRAAARGRRARPASASTTSPTRWPPPPRRSRWGSTATRSARGCAASPASRTGSSRSPRSTASASSTTPRRPTSPRPTVGLRAFEGGVHAILGGSEKGEPFAPLLDPIARALRRLLPDRRHRRPPRRRAGAGRRGRGRAAPLRRPRGRRAPRRRRGRVPARSSCSRRPAPASTPSRTSNSAASASARSSGSCDERPRPRAGLGRPAKPRKAKKKKKRPRAASLPTEYNMLLTATLCLLALRRGDGLLGQLDHPGPQQRRPLRQRLLPEADADVRRRRPA